MATFKVGQRVRLARSKTRPLLDAGPSSSAIKGLIGEEGVLVQHGHGDVDFWMLVDGFRTDHPSGCISVESGQLEPILPNPDARQLANTVIEWDACIWNPSHIHKQRTTEETSRV